LIRIRALGLFDFARKLFDSGRERIMGINKKDVMAPNPNM
jgi:hypothetical protein